MIEGRLRCCVMLLDTWGTDVTIFFCFFASRQMGGALDVGMLTRGIGGWNCRLSVR